MLKANNRTRTTGSAPVLFALFFLLSVTGLSANTIDEAKKAFLESNDQKALQLFEKARTEDPQNDEIYNYLGIIYQKMNMTAKAEQIYKEGISLHGKNLHSIEFNLANLYFNQKRYDEALNFYSQVINSGSDLKSKAMLNRAQVLLTTQKYNNAANDYRQYLVLEPATPQREKIERLLQLLADREAYEQEQIRLAEAEKVRKEAEAKRQKELMDSLLNDLNNSGEDTTGIGAGTEDVRDNFAEPGIDD